MSRAPEPADGRRGRLGSRRVERGRSRRHPRQRRGPARGRRAGRAARGREGQRLRPRRGAGGARRARRRRVVVGRRARGGRRAAARRRHRRADHAPVGTRAARRRRVSWRRASPRSCTPKPASTRWRRRSPTPDATRRSTCTSRSTPACTASAAPPTTRSRSRSAIAARDELDVRRGVHAPGGRRRTRQPLHRRAARAASTRCSHALDAAGLRPPLAHVGELRRAPRRRRALRPRARRHRAATASRRRRRWATTGLELRPALVAAGAGDVREVAARRRARAPTACAPRWARRAGSPPCPRGMPTACRATSGWSAARC